MSAIWAIMAALVFVMIVVNTVGTGWRSILGERSNYIPLGMAVLYASIAIYHSADNLEALESQIVLGLLGLFYVTISLMARQRETNEELGNVDDTTMQD